MFVGKQGHSVHKESILKSLNQEETSAFKKYQQFFVGRTGITAFLKYELMVTILTPMSGSIGHFLRKTFYPMIFRQVGTGAAWGRNITLRHPWRISIGDRVAIDDNCLLDAKGGGEDGISIGNDVLIARSTLIQAKAAPVKIGDRCNISSQVQLSSAGGIIIGNAVMVGGQSYIGGGLYHIKDRNTPIMDQGMYSRGPVVIEDDVWLGAGVRVLDGVRIGKGSVVAAGALVREDLPPYTVATPYQKLVMLPRGEAE